MAKRRKPPKSRVREKAARTPPLRLARFAPYPNRSRSPEAFQAFSICWLDPGKIGCDSLVIQPRIRDLVRTLTFTETSIIPLWNIEASKAA